MLSLNHRSTLPEKMDDPSVPAKDVHQALRELAIINKYLGGNKVTIDALNSISKGAASLSVIDIGCGSGDMLRQIAVWAKRRALRTTLTGVDINPAMTAYAASLSTAYPEVSYQTASIFDDSLLAKQADVVTNCLFCHHFGDESLVTLLLRMYALANRYVIINDLHRHPIAYHSIKVLTKLFSKSYLVKYDAPLSVARAFSRKELKAALAAAGITKYQLRWRWAWRWQLIIEKKG